MKLTLAGALAALAFCLVFTLSNFIYHQRVLERIRGVERIIERSETMLTSKWMSGGIEKSWTTTAENGETPDQVADRHDAEMLIMLKRYPRDPVSDDTGANATGK